jgi:hypothetical protein
MHRMTKNPRITITLTPSTHSILAELSILTGNSMSGMVSELLSGNEPIFDRMAAVLRAARDVQVHGKEAMNEALSAAQSKIEKQLGLALDAMDSGIRPILQEAEKVRRRGRKGAPRAGVVSVSGGVPTPISNRGVRSKKTIARSEGDKRLLVSKVDKKGRGVKNGQV